MTAKLIGALSSSDPADVAEARDIIAAYAANTAGTPAALVFAALERVLARPSRDIDRGLQAAALAAEEQERHTVGVVGSSLSGFAETCRPPLACVLHAVVVELHTAVASVARELLNLLEDLDEATADDFGTLP